MASPQDPFSLYADRSKRRHVPSPEEDRRFFVGGLMLFIPIILLIWKGFGNDKAYRIGAVIVAEIFAISFCNSVGKVVDVEKAGYRSRYSHPLVFWPLQIIAILIYGIVLWTAFFLSPTPPAAEQSAPEKTATATPAAPLPAPPQAAPVSSAPTAPPVPEAPPTAAPPRRTPR